MSQLTIGQRIKLLMDSEQWSIRKFARALEVADTNIRNYLDKGTKPSSDVLEKILQVFPATNPAWLLTGKGEPFLSDQQLGTSQTGDFNQSGTGNQQNIKGTKGGVQANSGGNNTINNVKLDDCKRDLAGARGEVEQLRVQLTDKDKLVASLEKTVATQQDLLDFLRGGLNRPN